MNVPKKKWMLLILLGLWALVLVLPAIFARSKPIWFSVSSDDIAHRFKYSLFNPFRDREPEEKAKRFLTLLKNGPCKNAYILVDEPEERRDYTCEREDKYKIQEWYLQYREDGSDAVILDYRTWRQSENRGGVYIGEPLRLTLKNQNGEWVIIKFDTWY